MSILDRRPEARAVDWDEVLSRLEPPASERRLPPVPDRPSRLICRWVRDPSGERMISVWLRDEDCR